MSRSGTRERRAHAVMDMPSRVWKAVKIEALLKTTPAKRPVKLLEVGCGSGGISNYFATARGNRDEVSAVDVVDNRSVLDGYDFQLVSDEILPFEDASFDVVLSNHVIEHVGDESAQLRHLLEIGRVLKRDGVGYLAVPNRWMVIEPHFGLAFLSCIPRTYRSAYVRAVGKGSYYDCEPLSLGECEKLIQRAGFKFENVCIRAARLTTEIEQPNSFLHAFLKITPDWLIRPFSPIIPTLIRVIRHPAAG